MSSSDRLRKERGGSVMGVADLVLLLNKESFQPRNFHMTIVSVPLKLLANFKMIESLTQHPYGH